MTKQSNASRLISLWGGVRATAHATGLDIATVSRWTSDGKRGTNGRVPGRYGHAIMKAAKRDGFPAQARVCIDWTCHECGGKISER